MMVPMSKALAEPLQSACTADILSQKNIAARFSRTSGKSRSKSKIAMISPTMICDSRSSKNLKCANGTSVTTPRLKFPSAIIAHNFMDGTWAFVLAYWLTNKRYEIKFNVKG